MIIDFHVHTAYYRSRTPAYMELLRRAWGERMDWMLETYSSPEAFALSRLHKNVYMEVSGLPPQKLLTYFPELERIAHKIIYGSDWPGVPTFKENIEALQGLNINAEAKQMILGKNAARLLKI